MAHRNMQYADNLYSADDSDLESFSDELSPTDGYFSNRDHPQDVMVPDPSLETGGSTTAESKAREARDEATANSEYRTIARSTSAAEVLASSPLRVAAPASPTVYSPSSPTAYTPRSPTSSSYRRADGLYSETSPLLHTAAPPPAYSAATSQPPLEHFDRNYSTISAHRLESGLHEPESMGGPSDFNERSPLWMKQVKKMPRWRLFRNVLLVLLVLGLAVGFIVAAVKSGESNKNHGGSFPDTPPSTGRHGGHGSYCSSGSTRQEDTVPTYEFKPGLELVVLQVTAGDSFRGGAARVRTAGEIVLRRLPTSEANQDTGMITFDVWRTDPGIVYRVEMDTDSNALKLVTPEFADISTSGDHCLSVEITVWIPSGVSFENLLVGATSLSIRLMDDVDFHVSEQSRFESSSSDILFPSSNLSSIERSKSQDVLPTFSSRETVVRSASGDVRGTICLYDLIRIETDSGAIDITVLPQPAPHDGASKTAQLTLGAASGNILCRYPIRSAAKIPDRDYRTSVSTHSGYIHGDYVIGTEASFKVMSGDINLTTLPTTFEESSFKTETNSGLTSVTVLEPLIRDETLSSLPADLIDIGGQDPYLVAPPKPTPIDTNELATSSKVPAPPLTHLTSAHESTSGDTILHYPSAWNGEITMLAISGNMRVGGDGVHIIKDSRKNWAYHEVVARKGARAEHAGVLKVNGVSGNSDVWIGESCTKADWCKMGPST